MKVRERGYQGVHVAMWAHTHQIRVIHNVLIDINSRSAALQRSRALYRELPLIILRRQLKTQRQLHIRTRGTSKHLDDRVAAAAMTNLIYACAALQATKAEQLHLPQHLWLLLSVCARGGGQGVGGWLAVSGARRFMYMCPLRWTGSGQHVRLCDTC